MTGIKKESLFKGYLKQWLVWGGVVAFLAIAMNCGPSGQAPVTEPVQPVVEPKEPTIEDLRKPVAKDPEMYKALNVLRELGRHDKKYISYEKFQELTKGQPGAAVNPDWFYDNYVVDINEEGYWINVLYGTSQRAMEKDPRIQKVMADLPANSITVVLKTPGGKSYLLNDAQGDGVLDFVKDSAKPTDPSVKVDIKLLDQMQEKYTWVIGLIKKHYYKVKK